MISARAGESSKVNSFHTKIGIPSGPGDFFVFKAQRVLDFVVRDVEMLRHRTQHSRQRLLRSKHIIISVVFFGVRDISFVMFKDREIFLSARKI